MQSGLVLLLLLAVLAAAAAYFVWRRSRNLPALRAPLIEQGEARGWRRLQKYLRSSIAPSGDGELCWISCRSSLELTNSILSALLPAVRVSIGDALLLSDGRALGGGYTLHLHRRGDDECGPLNGEALVEELDVKIHQVLQRRTGRSSWMATLRRSSLINPTLKSTRRQGAQTQD